MDLPLFLLAAVCVVNAPRSRTAIGGDDRVRLAALGAALTLAALVPVAVFAEPLLDAVDISPATARIAGGLLLVAMAILALGSPGPEPEPALDGWRAAVVPVAFPTLLTPGLAALVLVGAADHSAPVAAGVTAVALATLPLVLAVPTSGGISPRTGGPVRERVLAGIGRLLAALLVLAGLGLLFDGIFDI
ncbi:MAG TPA: MarC family protein [Acidimicrobiales bacterium]|nr:MarC family protein [Acidimicrobiales bacterium]